MLIIIYQLLRVFTCVLGPYHSWSSHVQQDFQPRREIVAEAAFQLVKALA